MRKSLCIIVATLAIGITGCSLEFGKDKNKKSYTCNFEKSPIQILEVPSPGYYGASFSAVDWDKDGTLDILAAESSGDVFVYINKNSQFYKSDKPILNVPSPGYYGPAFTVVDWDKDGKLDVLATDSSGKIFIYKNVEK